MLTIQREPLTRALERCRAISAQKSPLPILNNVLLESSGGVLRYRATDIQLGVSGEVSAAGKLQALCVSPKDLLVAVQSVPGDTISLVVKEKKLEVSGDGKRRFKLNWLDGEDFPRLSAVPDILQELPADFRAGLERVRHASLDESPDRPHLASLRVWGSGGSLSFAATDGHRISLFSVPSPATIDMQIPHSAVKALLATEGTLSAAQTEREMFFRCGAETLVAARLTAPFPPIECFTGLVMSHKMRIDAGALSESVAMLSRSGPGGVQLTIGTSGVSLVSESGDATDELGCEATGEEEMGFAGRYLVEPLKGITGQTEVEYTGCLEPIRIRAEGFLAVIMPMRIDVRQAKA